MKNWLLLLFILALTGCKDQERKQNDIPEPSVADKAEETQTSTSRGKEIYNNFCATCHLAEGQGIPGVFPPLKDSDWLKEKRTESIHAVKYGLKGPIEVNGETYNNLMPNPGLTDEEVAEVMNYIMSSWGNNLDEPVSVEEVAAVEK